MKIFAISDLHLSSAQPKPMDIFGDNWADYWETIKQDWNKKVNDDDVVLIAGDISWALRLEEAMADINQIAQLKGIKIILRGNHDYWWNTIGKLRRELPNNFFAIQNDCLRINNLLVCGTRGWTCPDGLQTDDDKKVYERELLRFKLSLDMMSSMRKPDDIVIVMMHFPPFNARREDSGFTRLITQYDIKTVVYGHLHGKDCRADLVIKRFGATMYLTSTDLIKHNLVEIV